jgi:hypothetical protein
MSTLLHTNTKLTLVEVAKRINNGQMAEIAEIATKEKPTTQHAIYLEANEYFSNKTTQRFSYPAGSWRTFNAGVASEVGKVTQIVDQIGMLETYAEHDYELVQSMPNPAQFRNDENAGFIEGLGETWAYQLFYGNALVDPEKWTGLAPRLATLNTTNVQGCGSTTAYVSSVYFVKWDPRGCHMVYPRGSMAGLDHEDLGKVTTKDSNNLMWEVYRDRFKWYCGLVVRDPKCIGRVANIETSATSNTFDENVFIAVKNNLRNQGRGFVAYCSTKVYTQIEIAVKDKSNVFHSIQDPFGTGEVPSIAGIPLYVDETILNTETYIS